MRSILALFLAVFAVPALADTSVRIIAEKPDAATDAAALGAALTASLTGERAGCPVTLDEAGDLEITVAHVAGPPVGWSVRLGPANAPTFSATGVAGETAAAGILDLLCPRQGGAAAFGPWQASGGGAEIVITGQVDDLSSPFSLHGEFPGGTGIFEYIPVTPGGGPVTYQLAGSGVTGSGEGQYSMEALPNGVYRLEQTTHGCVDGIANSCRTNTEVIMLTPVAR